MVASFQKHSVLWVGAGLPILLVLLMVVVVKVTREQVDPPRYDVVLAHNYRTHNLPYRLQVKDGRLFARWHAAGKRKPQVPIEMELLYLSTGKRAVRSTEVAIQPPAAWYAAMDADDMGAAKRIEPAENFPYFWQEIPLDLPDGMVLSATRTAPDGYRVDRHSRYRGLMGGVLFGNRSRDGIILQTSGRHEYFDVPYRRYNTQFIGWVLPEGEVRASSVSVVPQSGGKVIAP